VEETGIGYSAPSGLGLIEPETVEHEFPEQILAVIVEQQERVAALIGELRILLANNNKGD